MGMVLGNIRFRNTVRLLFLAWALGLHLACSAAPDTLLWFDHGRPTSQAIQAAGFLAAANLEGLTPADYNAQPLRKALDQAAHGPTQPAPVITRLDAALTAAMQRYLLELHQGRLDPRVIHQYFKVPPPTTYFDAAAYLSNAVASNQLAEAMRLAAPRIPLYARLRQALADYRQLLGHPAWKIDLAAIPGKKLEPGQAYEGMAVLTQRLVALGDLRANTPIPARYEGALVEGVRAFQQRHGLLADGILGNATFKQLQVTPARRVRQIELTLERLRWTPLLQAPRMIVVNIPEFVLRAYDVKDGKAAVRVKMKIIVGSALDKHTPVFDEDMRFIEFSPYWNVPLSIARAEIIPRLRRDPGYFQQQGFEFVTKGGQPVSMLSDANLLAVQQGQLRIRQKPGPHNALGDIKFVFPNDQNIYLHHTPVPQLFDRNRRDFSHGCIRVEDPVSLAKFVLQDDPEWTEKRIRDAMSSGTSKTIRLKQPLRVLITYSTVIVSNDKVYFFPDLYAQDDLLENALEHRVRSDLLPVPVQ
jgi:murein L,D-transpeptidase YcbB/YkuD